MEPSSNCDENKNMLLQLHENQRKINVGQTKSMTICFQEQRTSPAALHTSNNQTYMFFVCVFINIRHTQSRGSLE